MKSKSEKELLKGKITVLRSNRKTLAIEIGKQGVLVRAPFFVSEKEILVFLEKNRDWICEKVKKQEEAEQKRRAVEVLSPEDVQRLMDRAKARIPERVAYYASLMGVTYGRITIRMQRTRWGSCSAKGNLNFNCLLMLAPPEVLDSVVVHELCHRKEMNHSKCFYEEVIRIFPEYKKWNRWLKENGQELMTKAGI